MSTLTLKPGFSHGPSGSKRDVREQRALEAMQPRRTRTIALVAGAIAVALFALLAPIAWDPTHRLSSLYATSSDETVAEVRPFELRPTVMGPAITSEVLMRLEEDALHMPGIEVSVTPEGEEVVHPPEG